MRRQLLNLTFLLVAAPMLGASKNAPEESFDFAHRISPILAKVGCSAAECHGGATGQGGFKLSLFADSPRLDFEAIAQELGGRRLDFADPGNSLILRKPTRQGVKHKGGRLLRKGGFAYAELIAWIKRGAPFQTGLTSTLTGVEVRPGKDGVSVFASFEQDGKTIERDVTNLAVLNSSNEQVATIDPLGQVEMVGPGESWLLARYGKFNARYPVRQRFGKPAKAVASKHALDRVWQTRLRELGLKPARHANADILVRRLYIDLTGRPPSPYELGKFEKLPADERVAATVERLIGTSEFDRVFARHFGEFFEIPEAGKDPRNGGGRNEQLRTMVHASISGKQSVRKLTRKILTEPLGQTAWKHFADPRDRAEYIGRTMLGMRIGCARCHNHPLDRWTNAEHLGFSAYFSDRRPAPGGGMMAGKFFLPESGQAVQPQLLPLANHLPPGGMEPAEALAWFILDSGNDQFARNMVNRILGKLVGKPLVDLPDDHRLTNPAVHEPILDLLVEQFRENGADFRKLVRFIATSELYAIASSPPDEDRVSGDPELQYLARRGAGPLTPSQFKKAVEFVLGVAIDRPAPPDSPLAQQLYIMNSGLIQSGLKTPGNQVDAILDFQPDPAAQLQELFRLILARDPRPEERDAFLPLVQRAGQSRRAPKDLAFALLAGREFGSLR
jgi:hypothetical protein